MLGAQVTGQHIEQVADTYAACGFQIDCLQGCINVRTTRGIMAQCVLGFFQIQVTGTARNQDVRGIIRFFGNRDIARRKCQGQEIAGRIRRTGPTTRPITNFH